MKTTIKSRASFLFSAMIVLLFLMSGMLIGPYLGTHFMFPIINIWLRVCRNVVFAAIAVCILFMAGIVIAELRRLPKGSTLSIGPDSRKALTLAGFLAFGAGIVLSIVIGAVTCAGVYTDYDRGNVELVYDTSLVSDGPKITFVKGEDYYDPDYDRFFDLQDVDYRWTGEPLTLSTLRTYTFQSGNTVEAGTGRSFYDDNENELVEITDDLPISRVLIELPFEGYESDPATGVTLRAQMNLQMSLRGFIVMVSLGSIVLLIGLAWLGISVYNKTALTSTKRPLG